MRDHDENGIARRHTILFLPRDGQTGGQINIAQSSVRRSIRPSVRLKCCQDDNVRSLQDINLRSLGYVCSS